MNKTLLIALIIGGIAILGLGAFFLRPQEETKTESQAVNTETETEVTPTEIPQNEPFTGSFADLLTLGEDYQCAFDVTNGTYDMSGVAYIADSGNNLRVDMTMVQADGAPVATSVIRDGEYNYLWTDQQSQGFKSAITGEEGLFDAYASKIEDPDNQTVALTDDQDVNFDCDNWNVDSTLFIPPTNIEFVDFSETMKQMQESFVENGGLDCSLCDAVPAGEAREQCLVNLGC